MICIVFPHRKAKEIAGNSPRGHVELKKTKKVGNYSLQLEQIKKQLKFSTGSDGTLYSDKNC